MEKLRDRIRKRIEEVSAWQEQLENEVVPETCPWTRDQVIFALSQLRTQLERLEPRGDKRFDIRDVKLAKWKLQSLDKDVERFGLLQKEFSGGN